MIINNSMTRQEMHEKTLQRFQYYLDNQDRFVKLYNGKILVITDNGVELTYDNFTEAYFEAKEKIGLGNFILQKCSPGTYDYTYRPPIRLARII